VEDEIKRGIERNTGLTIESVKCPDDVEAKRGDRFRCAVRAGNGDRASVQVTQRDDDGAISYRPIKSR
jgi:hypothetical protein